MRRLSDRTARLTFLACVAFGVAGLAWNALAWLFGWPMMRSGPRR